jgi:site-specific DNA recombinase
MSNRAILYARVSTEEQADKGYSLSTQLDACRAEAGRRSLIVTPELTFTDDYSGATLDRPGMARLRAAVKAGDSVLVYDPDRLSRDDVDFLVICREWERAHVALFFVNGGEVPDTPEGDIVRYLMGWKSKRERKTIIERTQRGKRAKAASGKWVGNSHPTYGFRKVGMRRESQLEIAEDEANIVREIFRRFIEGAGIRPITDWLNAEHVPSPSRGRVGKQWYEAAVKNILRNKVYIGTFKNYGQTIQYPNLAIIHLGTWEAAQARLAKNRREYSIPRKRSYLLTGFIECACGRHMHGMLRKPGKRSYLYYVCYLVMHRLEGCHESVIPLPKVDAIVWGWIIDILCDDDRREQGLREYVARRAREVKPMQTEADSIDDLIEKAGRKVNRFAAEFGNAPNEIVAEAMRQQMNLAAQELSRLQERRSKLVGLIEQREISQSKLEEIRRVAAAIRRRLPGDPTFVQKRDLLDVLDVRVKLRRDEANCRWLDISCGIPDWDFSANLDCSQRAAA